MLVGNRHKTREASGLNIHIENYKLKQVEKQKLLGVFIDENLSWTAHIDKLCSTISSKIFSSKAIVVITFLLKYKNCSN